MRRFTDLFSFLLLWRTSNVTWNFCCGPGARKAQQPGNYTVTKISRERETKEREREREQDTYTKGTTPGGTRRLGSRFRRIWECSERNQSGFFYTFQARVGGRRCRSYIKSQVGRTSPRRGRRKPRRNKSGVVQRCTNWPIPSAFAFREWCVCARKDSPILLRGEPRLPAESEFSAPLCEPRIPRIFDKTIPETWSVVLRMKLNRTSSDGILSGDKNVAKAIRIHSPLRMK